MYTVPAESKSRIYAGLGVVINNSASDLKDALEFTQCGIDVRRIEMFKKFSGDNRIEALVIRRNWVR